MRAFASRCAGTVLRYHDTGGAGLPLLFVHGLGCASSCDYPEIAARLGRRCLLLDLAGAGFSGRPAGFAYTVAAHAAAVRELVESIGDVALFGHSAGGAIAIEAATCTNVRRLILSEPNLLPGGGFFSRKIAARCERDFSADEFRDCDPFWMASLEVAHAPAVHRLAVSLVEGSAPTWHAQLLALSIPRVVLYGSCSLPDRDAARLTADGIDVRIVDGVGHSMAHEDAAATAAAIAAALND